MSDSLPVEECLPALRGALADPGHAVLQAPPGAGKTTVVSLRLLGEPWLAGRILMLEPRRLATRAAARRMAATLGEAVGETVGYRTRDDRCSGPNTRIEVVTEGILTRRLQRDPTLPGVGLVIFDEAHERNLQTDLGLALVLDVRRSVRPDLRLLVMSATLAGDRIARVVGGDGPPAPRITSEGRRHDVDVRWTPRRPHDRLAEATVAAVTRSLADDAGDVLVFLPGAADIRRAGAKLGEVLASGLQPVDIRPLFGALPASEQDAALEPSPSGRRKVVLATDIAESSLTVEGVRVVIDAGLARVPRFDPRTGMTRLQTVAASKASAEQRAGRAGRTAPGVAYRLWSKVEHAARRPHIDPEITQVDLAGLALELAVWGTDPAELAFLDPPPRRNLDEARELLVELGALDETGRPTPAGRAMAELPLHPRLAHLLVAAREEGDGWLGCLVAALLEDRDVLRGPPDEVPTDLGMRVALLAVRSADHPLADRSSVRRAGERAADLARRAGIERAPVDPAATGRILAYAYPDRIGQRRGDRRGRFLLRSGSGAWLPDTDPLAGEVLIVAADLDGHRKEARVRLAAAIDEREVERTFAAAIEEVASLVWDDARDDLVAIVERRLGRLRLAGVERAPEPGPAAARALLRRVRATRLGVLAWTGAARQVQARVGLLRRHRGDSWPDLSDRALLRSLDDWLAPYLAGATRRADLERLDLVVVLRAQLTYGQQRDLDRLAPVSLTLPSGRAVRLDYGTGDEPPVLAVRVQELFGVRETPAVLDGSVPVVLHLLSPAGRPVQITSDLAGFWAGSWQQVRKEMAGRYPKHPWPEDPSP